MTSLSYHANGKLLLSGEYFILDGAKGIGMPCQYGQSLNVKILDDAGFINWKSKTIDQQTWFEGVFRKSDLSIVRTSDNKIIQTLQNILQQARMVNPAFLKSSSSLEIETRLEFPRLWGLGTSSTLIYNIAKWSAVDPFQLSKSTLGGSGYDIACAGATGPIVYQLKEEEAIVEEVDFDPVFKNQLYFVYLTKKQDSRKGIKRYRAKTKNNQLRIDEVSALTQAFLDAKTLKAFQKVMLEHERIVSDAIELPRAQDLYFPDFDGVVKSLGAWGGDFVLVATDLDEAKAREYFNKKGFEVFLRYDQLIC